MGGIKDHDIVHCKCHTVSHIIGAGMVAPQVENTPIAYFQFSMDEEVNLIPTIFTIIFVVVCMLLIGFAFFKDKNNVLKVFGVI